MFTNEKRLKGVLLIVSVYIYFKLYFFALRLISTNLPEAVTISTTSIFELIMIFIFILSVAPVSCGIRYLFLKFLEQK